MSSCLKRLILSLFLFFSLNVRAQDVWLQDLIDSSWVDEGWRPFAGKRMVVDEKTVVRRLKLATDKNNYRGITANATMLGYAFLNKADYGNSLKYFEQALAANRKLGLEKAQSVSLAQIGMVYSRMQNCEKASLYLKQSLEIMGKQRFQKGIGPVASIAGKCAARMKNYPAALNYYQQSLQANQSLNNTSAAGIIYSLIGEIYIITDDYENAMSNFNKASSALAKTNDAEHKAIVERDIGLVYFKKGVFDKALQYFNKSLAFDNEFLVTKLKKEALMKLFTIYSFNKDFDKADIYHEQYRSIKDSIDKIKPALLSSEDRLNEQSERENIIAMLERKAQEQQLIANQKELELSEQITATDIERQNKEKALEQLQLTSEEMEKITKEKALSERDLAVKELQLNRQRSFRNLLIFITVIIGVLGYFIYNRYRINKINNARLEKANSELASTLEELRRTQDQLIHSEKLASLGQMTAGIAHEIKNPLNFINNFSEVSVDIINELKDAISEEEKEQIIADIAQNLTKIAEHSKRADNIVKNMLLHSRKESVEWRLTDVNKLIEESYHLAYNSMMALHPEFRSTVQYSLEGKLPSVKIQYQEIERVLINILDNAFYAMMKKGKTAEGYEPVITMMSGVENNFVKIAISDNANGMPPDILKNIFQPFFTTKPAGEGTGLGLSLAYDIIHKTHNGTIEAKSELGAGTLFTIKLPVV